MAAGQKYHFVWEPGRQPIRIDVFLSQQIPHYSRSFFQKLIRQGLVTVNGRSVKVSHKLLGGEVVAMEVPAARETGIEAENLPLEILYEDANLLVVNKPAGMAVHPGAGVPRGTLVNALLYHCKTLSGVGGRLRPGIVHRLDKNTSGLLVVAKNDAAHIDLQRQFAEKTARREYLALVWGHLPERQGRIETLVNRSKSDRKKFTVAEQGKPAVTLFEVEEYFSFLTLVRVRLKTGRTHQIRLHFQYLHHPVFGDPEYAGRNKQLNRLSTLSHKKIAVYLLGLMNRQALHACRLCFTDPVSKQPMEFTAPLPDDFKELLNQLKKYEREL